MKELFRPQKHDKISPIKTSLKSPPPLCPRSLMSGLSAMDTKASGRLGVLTITYYLWTTFIAVIVGIILVLLIHPGIASEKDNHHVSSGPVMTSADALLDLIRSDPYTHCCSCP